MAFHWKDWFQEQHHKHKKKKKRRREDEPWRMRFDCEDCNSQSGKPAKFHQNPSKCFFKKKAFRRFFSFARSSIPRPEEEKSEESEHARRRRKVAESDWNVKNKKTIRPPYWRNSTDEGKNTGVVLLRALTSTWPASPFLHAVYQTIIILSQIRLDDLVISTIFR